MKINWLYGKISLILLVLLGVIGVMYLLITGYTTEKYLQEMNQRLYANIAERTVTEVQPLVDGKVDTSAIQEIMHSMMVINPSVEVYLLDPIGNIITYVAPYKKVVLDRVGLDPVKEYLKGYETGIVLGDDPRHPGRQKVFSAAPIKDDNGLQGYAYIILASEEQEAVTDALFGSYFLQLGSITFLLCLLGALGIGLLAIWLLTRNLRKVIETVQRFQEGDQDARMVVEHLADFTPLPQTFNHMADTLQANIERLQAVENLRRELIANVSHDLRTPLAIMQGYVETMLIKEESLDGKDRRKYLNIVLDSSENLSRLIDQLFEYAKLEASQVEPVKEPFQLSELVQDVWAKYQILAEEKALQLEVDAATDLPLVFADVALVERVLQNLLDNALKFTPEGGRVKIQLSNSEAAGVQVRVADSGPGIPEEEQSHIFDRYQRGSRTGPQAKGAGLGLAIVKKILELHDARIRVQSQLNEGTAFWFELPGYRVAGS
ncbi:MAG: HAMP domain-containing sensor histidine kinase [Bacteroidota bacterium]